MIKQGINVFPFTLIVLFLFLALPETTQGLLTGKNQASTTRSELLLEKMAEHKQLKEVCGSNQACRFYGPDFRVNEENVYGLVTFLAELEKHR